MEFLHSMLIQGKETDIYRNSSGKVFAECPGKGNNWGCGVFASIEYLREKGVIGGDQVIALRLWERATYNPLHSRHEVLHWDGPGWYASRQEGSHEDTHISTYKVGDWDDEKPDVYSMCLGTPQFFQDVPEGYVLV